MLTKIFKNKDKLFILLIIIIGFILYANTFGNQFLWDDYLQITQNSFVKNFNIDKIFTTSIYAGAGWQKNNFYRPVVLLSFAFDYKLWGDRPAGFHFTNLLIHILSAILIYLIFSLLQPKKIVSFFTSLLFLIHPLRVESVTYISGRTDLLPVFFMLLSLYLFIQIFFKTDKKSIYYVLSLISFVLALFSKELAVVLPILLLVVYFSFIKRKFTKTNIKDIAIKILPFLSILVIYLILRFVAFELKEFSSNELLGNLNIFSRFVVFSKALLEYWKIILVPTNLHYRLDRTIPLTSWDPKVIFSLIILAFIVYFSILSLKKKRFLFFGFSWFFIGLIPVSNVFVPINFVLGERWLRLPSIGLFFLAALAIDSTLLKLQQYKLFKKAFITLLLIYFIVLSVITIKTNTLWKDPITYFTYLLNYNPNELIIRHNLGLAYEEKGMDEEAFKQYQKALEIDPDQSITHFGLGLFYQKQNNFEKALEEYEKTIDLNKYMLQAYVASVDLYVKLGRYDEAISQLEKLRDLQPNSWKPYSLLADVYILKKDYPKAIELYEKALELNPENKEIKNQLRILKGSQLDINH